MQTLGFLFLRIDGVAVRADWLVLVLVLVLVAACGCRRGLSGDAIDLIACPILHLGWAHQGST